MTPSLFPDDNPRNRKGSIPETFVELALAGYRHEGHSVCRCGARIEWFLTPKNRRMPMSLKLPDLVVGEDAIYLRPTLTKYESHFINCPFADKFRRKK